MPLATTTPSLQRARVQQLMQQQMQQQVPAQAAHCDLLATIWRQQQTAQQLLPALSLQQRSAPAHATVLAGTAARSYSAAVDGAAHVLTTPPGALPNSGTMSSSP